MGIQGLGFWDGNPNVSLKWDPLSLGEQGYSEMFEYSVAYYVHDTAKLVSNLSTQSSNISLFIGYSGKYTFYVKAINQYSNEASSNSSLTVEIKKCGDSTPIISEECDDGNLEDFDGCSSDCLLEEGYACSGIPQVCTPDSSNTLAGSSTALVVLSSISTLLNGVANVQALVALGPGVLI